MAGKNYNFGEKQVEKAKDKTGAWVEMKVWQSPKFLQSRTKAIELIESKKYDLDEGDFWILMNKGGNSMVYTGLIISHNGCLKINDKLESSLRFKPESASIYKDSGNGNIVMSYINQEQGLYEFGEVSPSNCKNEYIYAMVLKRLQDRVILKNSKVGFYGIYSEAESDDFKQKKQSAPEEKPSPFGDKRVMAGLSKAASDDMTQAFDEQDEALDVIKMYLGGRGSIVELEAAWREKENDINTKLNPTKKKQIIKFVNEEKARISGE